MTNWPTRDRPHSYSSLATLATCCEKFRLSYIERLEDPSVNLPMRAGSALDAALNHLYVVEWDLDGALERLRDSWGDTRPPLGAKHSWLTLPFLEERVRLYMEEREARPTILEDGEILKAFSGEMHEFEWPDPETGEVISLRGIPDFVLRHGGRVWVPDLKCTTQWVNDFWMIQFRIGNQLRVYAAMVQEKLGVEVAGGLINAVYMGEKALDPPEAWKKRKSAPSALKTVDFTQEQIRDTWAWARGLMHLEETCARTGYWPRNEHACGMYGSCEYLDLCTAPSEMVRRSRMMTNFRRKEERP